MKRHGLDRIDPGSFPSMSRDPMIVLVPQVFTESILSTLSVRSKWAISKLSSVQKSPIPDYGALKNAYFQTFVPL